METIFSHYHDMKPYELITLCVSTQEVETVQKPSAYNITKVYKNHIAHARAIQNLKSTTPSSVLPLCL